MQKRTRLMAVVFALVVLLVGTSSVLAQSIACTGCHNDTTLITGKKTAWSESKHGTGDAYGRGTRSSCTGCHSGGGFSERVAAGLAPNQVEAGDPNPTRQSCRTCHQIHTSYTAVDLALETTAPVALFAFEETTFDGGKGNLCANCHQPRRTIAEADADGNIAVTSTHWGPHHGGESSMLLGVGGAGDVAGVPSWHYRLARDTCVTCHLGENRNHTFEPVMSASLDCHDESFDLDVARADIVDLIAQVGDLLIAKGLLDDHDHPVVGVYPAAEAAALWNYIFIVFEDGSLGVHNAPYTKALLQAALAALQ